MVVTVIVMVLVFQWGKEKLMALASLFLTLWLQVWHWLEWIAPEGWDKVGRQGCLVSEGVQLVLLVQLLALQ